MILAWRENLTIGVEHVDNQHKEIFNRLNKLFVACSEGLGLQEMNHLMTFLENYVEEHFTDEEKLQKDSDYPEYTSHLDEHKQFKQEIANMKYEINRESDKNHILNLHQLVTDWLVHHIQKSDRAFGVYYREMSSRLK